MKVYVITAGDYSDYHIVAVTEDKEKADNYVKEHNERLNEDAYAEEYDTDDFDIVVADRDAKYFLVRGNWNYYNECIDITCYESNYVEYIANRNRPFYSLMGKINYWIYYCPAEDQEHAIKKATDWAAQQKAEQKGVI